jgi:hypothetical protein
MSYKLRGFEIAQCTGAGNGVVAKSSAYNVQATTNRDAAGQICPGKLIVLSATANYYDGMAAADCTAVGRKVAGLCSVILDTTGHIKVNQYLGVDEAGKLVLWDLSNVILRGTEDAVGGAATGTTGTTIAGAFGTITGYADETFVQNPVTNDLLDSSTVHATDYSFVFQGLDPRPDNTATAKTYLFTIKSTYLE